MSQVTTVQGVVEYQDIGPGKYELVTPTITYNLALDYNLKQALDSVYSVSKAKFAVKGTVVDNMYTVGGTTKQTLIVESFDLV